MTWFTPDMKRALYRDPIRAGVDGHDSFSAMEEWFERSRGWDPLSRIQYLDIKTYLPEDILAKVDRASMAHSLEVRVPLLDHVVMEYAASIPAGLKLRGGEAKHILKRALDGVVPREVLDRPKMGFSVPLARWLRTDLKPVFEKQVLAAESYVGTLFHGDVIRTWWGEHLRGRRDHAYNLWALLVLEQWGRRFGR
jgi:asparagine synthase (glutamine-hydrolysing)